MSREVEWAVAAGPNAVGAALAKKGDVVFEFPVTAEHALVLDVEGSVLTIEGTRDQLLGLAGRIAQLFVEESALPSGAEITGEQLAVDSALQEELTLACKDDAELRGTVDAGAPVWTTNGMQTDFKPIGFMAPFISVERRSDGAKGSLRFTHSPRFYYSFVEA
jgi:hypothetical protein